MGLISKEFFVKDKSGRGFSNTLDYSHFAKHWNFEDTDEDGEVSLGEYLQDAEIGDTWKTNSIVLTCTKL